MQGKHMPGRYAAAPEKGAGLGIFGKVALITLVSIAALAVAGAAAVGIYANHIYTGIFPGVSVEGIALDGQTLPGAQGMLDQQLAARVKAETVTVTADGEVLGTYTREELGVEVHTAAAALKAYAVGREEGAAGWVGNAVTLVKGWLGERVQVEPNLSYDETRLGSVVSQLKKDFYRDSADAFYELTDDGLFATKECTGRELDGDVLAQLLCTGESEVEAPFVEIPGEPLDLQAMADAVSAEALPTRYDIEQEKVVEGQRGVAVDVEASQYVLDAAAEGERVKLPASVTVPDMTAEEMEAVLFRDLLATASTTVTGTNARKENVRLSGEFVNGTILNHGDVFDYNLIVGERTEERGFGKASAYRNGETVQELGGGICQTSSTVYYAVLLANLEIVERANHRFYPGYIELGLDATVSWGGPEFRFRNDTGYPIRIEVIYEKNTLTVNIYGTKTDDTYVVMTHEVLETTPYQTVYQETTDLAWGTEQVKQSGYTGYKVITYRNVYDGEGNLISSEVEAKSTYSKRDKIVLVGISGKPSDEEPTIPDDGGNDDPGIIVPDTDPPGWL